MKITVLAENTTASCQYLCEHGLSLLIETEQKKILFDAGQTDLFSQNANALGISLDDIDYAILSHGHYDHSGGLETFFQINKNAPLYLSSRAFENHCNAEGKYIGLSPLDAFSDRLVFVNDFLSVHTGASLFSCNGLEPRYPIRPYGLQVKRGDGFSPDTFSHEMYLLFNDHGKRILYSGCSHKGILNIVHWFKPDILIGGFHLMKVDCNSEDGMNELVFIANELKKTDTVFYTAHCTGMPQFSFLKSHMKDQIHYLSAGTRIEL